MKKVTLRNTTYEIKQDADTKLYFITEENSSFRLTDEYGEHEEFASVEDAEDWLIEYVNKGE